VLAPLLVLAVFLASQVAAGQEGAAESASAKGHVLVLKAGRSHAGGRRYIPVTLRFGDEGIDWRFEEEFKREVEVPWSSLKSWSCWGEAYGYKLDLVVDDPKEGGGTFKLERDDLKKAEERLLLHAGEKTEERCTW
jgi:hypothetical protein